MAQQQPQFNYQQYPGAYQGTPAWGTPQGYGYGYPTINPAAGGMPGVDPKQMQAVLNALQNPNAGDQVQLQNPFEENPFFPKPEYMGYGALAGLGMSPLVTKLFHTPGPGQEYDLITRVANKLDKLPGIRHASEFLENNVITRLMAHSRTVSKEKQRYYQHLLNRLPPRKAQRYVTADIINTLRGHLDDDLLNHLIRQVKSKTAEPAQAVLGALENGEKFLINKNLQKLPKNIPAEALQELQNVSTFKEARKIISRHGLKKEAAEFLQTIDKTAAKRLFGLRTRLRGEVSFHFEPYRVQQGLTKTLRQKNVGPIGRAFVTVSNTMRRIISGQTLMVGKKAAEPVAEKSFLRSLPIVGPALMGALVVGQSFQEASKAKEGEKLSAFMHDFIGFGIGNFVGWEIGRHLLKKGQIFTKAFEKLGLGKLATRHLFRIPLIGKGFTIVGFLVEMTAIFGFGSQFQKAGEWISHKIFGKPSHITKEELEAKGITQAMAPEEGHPLQRSSRFSQWDMDLDHKVAPVSPAQVAQPTQLPAPTHPAAMPSSPFTLSPEEIMQSPAAADFAEFERSLGL